MPFFENEKLLFIHIPKTGGTSIEKYFQFRAKQPLGFDNLYYSYYEKSIQSDLDKYRKLWKHKLHRMRIESDKNKFDELSIINRKKKKQNDDSSVDSNNVTLRETIPEFILFRKMRLSRDLGHSLQHLTWSELQENKDILWEKPEHKKIVSNDPYERNEYEIITVVRNPYDRIISELLFLKILNNDTLKKPKIVFEYLKKFLEQYDSFDNHKIPQYLFLIDSLGNMIPNLIILHTETLTQDMRNIGYVDFNHYYQVSKIKTQPGVTKYSNSLNRESMNLINKYYKRDFELFGYDFL